MKTSLWYLKNYPYLTLVGSRDGSDSWRRLAPGDAWSSTDGHERAFIIAQGRLQIRRVHQDRSLVCVDTLNAGDIVGTLTARDLQTYTDEAVALDPCVGYVVDGQTLRRRVRTRQLPAITFVRLEGWTFRRYESHPRDLVFRTLADRLASVLQSLAQRYSGTAGEDKLTLACTPEARHLADLTGSSVEQTRQMMDEFQTRDLVEWTDGRIALKNVASFWDIDEPAIFAGALALSAAA